MYVYAHVWDTEKNIGTHFSKCVSKLYARIFTFGVGQNVGIGGMYTHLTCNFTQACWVGHVFLRFRRQSPARRWNVIQLSKTAPKNQIQQLHLLDCGWVAPISGSYQSLCCFTFKHRPVNLSSAKPTLFSSVCRPWAEPWLEVNSYEREKGRWTCPATYCAQAANSLR